MPRGSLMMDANEAVAHVAYQTHEVIAIYPITPASPMGEFADQWAAQGRKNLWGVVPTVVEMQSEAGAAGVVHGALQSGSLTTTFTASQGLLLMLPNMFKIAGELTPMVLHVAARSIATQGLSIFGDHSDVMAARSTGFAMLASASVQEAADFALLAHAASLSARVPFLHFFDGFRTSHEVNSVQLPSPEVLAALIQDEMVAAHRGRALSPDHPFIRGTSQNPDVHFQARETVNPYYRSCPTIVQNSMDELARWTGREYKLCDYVGAADAEVVLVAMGSAVETIQETIEPLVARGEKVGLIKIRLYRPFPLDAFLASLPGTVRTVVVLDRTKEPGSLGEPLYLDVVGALHEMTDARELRDSIASVGSLLNPINSIRAIGGRYGLASKEFTPGMVLAILDEGARTKPKRHFTIGIRDDVTYTSLEYDNTVDTEKPDTVRALFYGLGSDGTVGANKNSIKIIGEETELYAQGYFVYDSKKSGSMTVSHLRFGPNPIRSSYLISSATFVACHQTSLLNRVDVLEHAQPGSTFLLNAPWDQAEVWDQLPFEYQSMLINKRIRLFVIDADGLARELGLPGRISTIMQACFFALSNVLPRDQAIASIKRSIHKSFIKRGEAVVQKNNAAVDAALERLHEISIPSQVSSSISRRPAIPAQAPAFVRNVIGTLISGQGDRLPVSAIPADGTWPSGTARWEKRAIAHEIPVWDRDVCIQCGKCVLVCPHAVIRGKLCQPSDLESAPHGFLTAPARWPEHHGELYTLQVAPEDCTGCALCVEVCPAKNKSQTRLKAINMQPLAPCLESQANHWDFFTRLPEFPRHSARLTTVKDVQLLEPLFEFSGACAGCGETPYLKLLTQLFGDRLMVANATGCSSIYGGNLPTTPWSLNRAGRGPAWSNSLFEDNAEFGLGMRVSLDHQELIARQLLEGLAPQIGNELVAEILKAEQHDDAAIEAQRIRIGNLVERLETLNSSLANRLIGLAGALVRKSVWIVGGDGWAYDIGFGGLDHVLASGRNVNILVLDTEVYSNTGGQMSKATPRAAVAKFAAGGKPTPKKDLALMALTYGRVYVARIAFGANDAQTLRVLTEAESYPGVSLVIAYSTCIAHGYDLIHGLDQQKLAVQSGYWPLIRFDPRRADAGEVALQMDSKPPAIPLEKYIYNETRYTVLRQSNADSAKALLEQARSDVYSRWQMYEHLARLGSVGEATGNEGHK